MTRIALFALAGLAALTAGCATTRTAPVDVTRYHLGQPVTMGTIVVEPMSSGDRISPEFQTYADAVAAELGRLGFTPAGAAPSNYIAGVAFTRSTRGRVATRPPVTIGLGVGGSSGGYRSGGVGVGVGGSVGLGGGEQDLIVSELWVQLRRRGDNTVVWEGRAQTESLGGAPDAQPIASAQRLAAALFKGFPGESGITISVP